MRGSVWSDQLCPALCWFKVVEGLGIVVVSSQARVWGIAQSAWVVHSAFWLLRHWLM